MEKRIQDFWERKSWCLPVSVIVMALFVRVWMIVTTDSRYYAMFERELTRGQEGWIYFGAFLFGALVVWSGNLYKRFVYPVILTVFPAFICYSMKNIYAGHWTMKLAYSLFFAMVGLVGIRMVLTIVYDCRQSRVTKNLGNRAGALYMKGLLWLPLIFSLCIVSVKGMKPQALEVSKDLKIHVSALPKAIGKSREQLWMEHPEEMRKLNATVFSTLSMQERLEALKFVMEVELAYLGCEGKVELMAEDTERATTHGFFAPASGQICVQNALLEKGYVEECIETIMHECYHLYQYECVRFLAEQKNINSNLLMFQSVAKWEDCFINYQDSQKDYTSYRNQSLEDDAFDYAYESLREILRIIPTVVTEEPVGEGTWAKVKTNTSSWDREAIVGWQTELTAEQKARYEQAEDYTDSWEFLFPRYEDGIKLIAQMDAFRVYVEYSQGSDGEETNRVTVRTRADEFIHLSVDYLTLMKNAGFFASTETRFVEKDYDEDGAPELAILFTIAEQNYSVDKLFVVDKGTDGRWQAYQLTGEIYQGWLEGREVVEATEDGRMQLLLDGKRVGKVLDLSLDHYYMGGSWVYTKVPTDKSHDFELVYEYIAYLSRGFTGYFPGNALLEKIDYLGEGQFELRELSCQEMKAKNPVMVDMGH